MPYQVIMTHEKTGTHQGEVYYKDAYAMKEIIKDLEDRNPPWKYSFKPVGGRPQPQTIKPTEDTNNKPNIQTEEKITA